MNNKEVLLDSGANQCTILQPPTSLVIKRFPKFIEDDGLAKVQMTVKFGEILNLDEVRVPFPEGQPRQEHHQVRHLGMLSFIKIVRWCIESRQTSSWHRILHS